MKKFAGLFFVLLAIHSVQGMDLYNPTDEQCKRVALYLIFAHNETKRDMFEKSDAQQFRNPLAIEKTKQFLQDTRCAIDLINNIPSMSLENLHIQTQHYRDSVRLRAGELSRLNMFVFVTFNQDILTSMYQKCLPLTYEDRAGFFSEKSNSEVRKVNSKDCLSYPILSRAQMVEKLKTFPLDKALYIFAFVEIPQSPLSKIKYENELDDSSCKNSTQPKIIPRMDYQWTYEDCKNLTAQQMAYLDAAVHGLNDTDWEHDNRLMITDEVMRAFNHETDKKNSNPVQDFILKNEKYGNQSIKVDITSSTRCENIRNKVLCIVPHGLAMIIPDLIQSQTNGVGDSLKGIVICAAGSFGFGQFVYPMIDSYNSDVCKLSQWYGSKNYKKTRVGQEFILLSLVSSLAHLTAQKFLSWSTMPGKIVGGGIYIIRALLSCMALVNIEDFYNAKPYRRNFNEKGVPFTLKDLANGPKFTKQQ